MSARVNHDCEVITRFTCLICGKVEEKSTGRLHRDAEIICFEGPQSWTMEGRVCGSHEVIFEIDGKRGRFVWGAGKVEWMEIKA